MKPLIALLFSPLTLTCMAAVAAEDIKPGENPADHLPPYITRLTGFGERADWSPDGRRLLFLSKTFGDALELDLETKLIRNRTAHYPHYGYTRALYLTNGDILLSGPEQFDPKKAGEAREQCWLFVLDRSGTKPASPLGTKCSEGPAVSRHRLHIAWTHVAAEYPDEMAAGSSRMQEADVIYENGRPKLANQRLIINSRDLPFTCTLETQNFRPPAEEELTFSAYGYQGTEVCSVNLLTKKVAASTCSRRKSSITPMRRANTMSRKAFTRMANTRWWNVTNRTARARATWTYGSSSSMAAEPTSGSPISAIIPATRRPTR
jgi:hypothetical protein